MCVRSSQRGIAALLLTVLLCFTMILAIAFAQRNIVVEERRSANELRTAQAFEAAEAGLEWALARINDPTPIDDACAPSATPTARSLRQRMLRITVPDGHVVPSTWDDAGTVTPLRAACVRGATGWSCSCPAHGRPTLPVPAGPATATTFAIELAALPRPGMVRISVDGCTRADSSATCAAAGDGEASAHVEATWALLPALRAAPVAALTVRGDVTTAGTAIGVHNADRSSAGLALLAGGRINGAALRVSVPHGSPLGGSIVSGDRSLSASSPSRVFTRHFGMDATAWSSQPAARRLACAGDCTGALSDALAGGARIVFIEGDLTLTGPATFGTADDPVVIATTGALHFVDDIAIHGVVHGASLRWDGAGATGAFVRGATLVAGDVSGDAPVDFIHDSAALGRLKTGAGSFVRINGSWKDF